MTQDDSINARQIKKYNSVAKKIGDTSIQQLALWRQTRNYCVNFRYADSTELYSFIFWGDDQYLHDRWV